MLYQHCVGSFARELSFMQAAASVKMGSQLPFAAIRLNVRFADKADIMFPNFADAASPRV